MQGFRREVHNDVGGKTEMGSLVAYDASDAWEGSDGDKVTM